MAFSYSPRIVTDGLVFYVDAANRNSYVSGDTVWNDLIEGNNGTLTNGPIFDSGNGGSIVFDGSNDYVDLSTSTGLGFALDFSLSSWVKTTSLGARQFIVDTSTSISLGNGYSFRIKTDGKIRFWSYNGATNNLDSVSSVTTNTWNFITCTHDSVGSLNNIYINGVLDISGASGTNTVSSTTNLTVGDSIVLDGNFNGNISNVSMYNKVLSSDEVLQNYNALKGRFVNKGLVTDGLIMHLNTKDKKSLPPNTLLWNDVSGNQYNMDLDNASISYNTDGTLNLAGGGATYAGGITTATTCTVVIWMKTTDGQAALLNGQSNTSLGRYSSGNKELNQNSGSPDYYMDLIERDNVYDYITDGEWHMHEFKDADLSLWTSIQFCQLSSYTFSNGEVAIISIYDRSLTAAESAQNFGTFKSKFGI